MNTILRISSASTLILCFLLAGDCTFAKDNKSSSPTAAEMSTLPSGAGKTLSNMIQNGNTSGQETPSPGSPQTVISATVRLHVPLSLSGIPPEITAAGAACTVRIPGMAGIKKEVLGRVRSGGHTIVLNIPVTAPFTASGIHGSYDCRLLLRQEDGQTLSMGHIKQAIELDPAVPTAEQVIKVHGNF